ncbi:constitutive coactivator of peroxisome proliferator-activated receptor gamma-like isoform X1 [Zootermopsis nevadensis]|uniref:constitutive coactivator of peroxisome proliferator-activated receptor gamma-like isoform X1 n=1 Tax=Zootermopsis nevadensis TaxID=136037 RepID=UPI000B8E6832|nr:constitutive coactivator of peroxisome proliferator-activated receptor gamma-like isoform X1 [Zootermopsis nevadensis]
MGVFRLQTFLDRDVPNEYCWEVSVKELADEYRNETGTDPVVIADGSNCLRSIHDTATDEWILGGQVKEFVQDMKNFVAAFQGIGVRVMFFFDGITQEQKRGEWLQRRGSQIKKVMDLFNNLNNKNVEKSKYSSFLLPPLIGATGRFIAKFECGCDVRISISECDAEIAEYAQREGCFAILSRDTDFILLDGARHYLSIERLDMAKMTTVTYSREGLLDFLKINQQQLFLLASLLGNDTVHFHKLKHFHKRFSHTGYIFEVLPGIVEYINKWNFIGYYKDEDLREIARDVFGDENMANDLSVSIKSYLPPSRERTGITPMNDIQDKNWQQILELAREKHCFSQAVPSMYPVMLGKAYELSISLENYGSSDTVPTAKIYQPLRQRIYGVLLHEKPTATTVKEWCIDSKTIPTEPTEVSVMRICNIERFHPGLIKLWDETCEPYCRWHLFAQSLTEEKKLDAKMLERLGLPYAVPVAVLFYLLNECTEVLTEVDVDVILAQAVLVRLYTCDNLKDIRYQHAEPTVIHLSTIFNRGVTTVLFLLSACGFELKEAMPWLYFDGKLFQQKYNEAKRKRATQEKLCEDKKEVLLKFREMKRLVLPQISWR